MVSPNSRARRHRGSQYSAQYQAPPPPPPVVSPTPSIVTATSLPTAQIGVSYSTTLSAVNGTAPYTWAVTAGSLSGSGLTLSAAGVLSGMPSGSSNVYSFTATVTDHASQPATKAFSVSVNAVSGSAYSGPTLGRGLWTSTDGFNTSDNISWATGVSGNNVLLKFASWGIDWFSMGTGFLAGYGGTGSWATSLDGANQQQLLGYPSWSTKPNYLGVYVPNVALTDDAGWSALCSALFNMCQWASVMGWKGVTFDWENVTWANWKTSGLTEAAARAKATQRGTQMMTAMVSGWNPNYSNPLRLINYAFDFAEPASNKGGWRVWQDCYNSFGGSWAAYPTNSMFVDVAVGMSAVSGYESCHIIDAGFYKQPQGGRPPSQAGWDFALGADKAYHRDLFNRRFSNPTKWGWGPFGWVGGTSGTEGSFGQVQSVAAVQLQYSRFVVATYTGDPSPAGGEGIDADFRYGSWVSFDPTPYSAVYSY